jgi:hypothetical protein
VDDHLGASAAVRDRVTAGSTDGPVAVTRTPVTWSSRRLGVRGRRGSAPSSSVSADRVLGHEPEAEAGRGLRELLVKDRHVLARAFRERLRHRPAAPFVEADRKVRADPGVGDSMLHSPPLQVLHQRPSHPLHLGDLDRRSCPLPRDWCHGARRDRTCPADRPENLTRLVVRDEGHGQLFSPRLTNRDLEPPRQVLRL